MSVNCNVTVETEKTGVEEIIRGECITHRGGSMRGDAVVEKDPNVLTEFRMEVRAWVVHLFLSSSCLFNISLPA